MRRFLLLLMLCASGAVAAAEPQPLEIRVTAGADPYVTQLLELALSYQPRPVILKPVAGIPTQSRAVRLLGKPSGIDVFWSVTSRAREQQALAVRIPLVKGLLGYRVLFIAASRAADFVDIKHWGQLQPVLFGLRHDWPDRVVFELNGLQVVAFHDTAKAMSMLSSKRLDVVPLDILAAGDFSSRSDIMVQPQLLIHYPSAVYLFVDKANTLLHALLQQGLEQAIADGCFEWLFRRHFARQLEQLDLAGRTRLNLSNPTLSAETPLSRSELWYQPGKYNDNNNTQTNKTEHGSPVAPHPHCLPVKP
ncbi:transporter substrate-binding domain-containing protein [Pseudoalteromonas sp. OOF1S-7]|uniref:transporter substrate-binding domain-containing protein n=1 Tax=Pseudoalteromonas sp. OOF1S-7 TaxID=2917757 RepID=UPI001EF5449F|nr:transporter substrate-binding domain-containing protein [Pseudoalteromonas sp. OOF1S-7]MCG7534730.1 transporter substrate-binding domain-containing protein [Pseudoalteromonas sp. OOF1S-7]